MLVVGLAVPFLILDTPGTAQGATTAFLNTEATVALTMDTSDEKEVEEPAPSAVVVRRSSSTDANDESAEARLAVVETVAVAEANALLDGQIRTAMGAGMAIAAELAEVERLAAEAEAAAVLEREAAAQAEAEAEEAEAAQAAADAAQAEAEAAQAAAQATEDVQPAPQAAAPESVGPVQVDGRVPPPAGGPSAAQWDQLRNCESTHNYSAVNPSGKFRGAYQFSQTTWDWVAGIHYPQLVGADPAAAEPASQDLMAYALYSMNGAAPWPECGRFL